MSRKAVYFGVPGVVITLKERKPKLLIHVTIPKSMESSGVRKKKKMIIHFVSPEILRDDDPLSIPGEMLCAVPGLFLVCVVMNVVTEFYTTV